MPNSRCNKTKRVPWSGTSQAKSSVTLPVYMAYCAIAAALRPWNQMERKVIITLSFSDDYYKPVHSQASQIFGRAIWKSFEYETFVFEWSDKSFRDQAFAEQNQRGIFLAPPTYQLTDDEMLFSDAIVEVGPRSRRHAQAALRRAALPVDERLVDLLVHEPWSRLCSAFQDRRGALQGLERLRQQRHVKLHRKSPQPQCTDVTAPTLEDMHGFGPALEWGHNLAKDLADYKLGLIQWKDVDSGVLLSGPPGIGKTMFASALANTCGVPIVYGSVSRWQEAGSLDDHLRAMRASFTKARADAPSILFIDEIDAFGRRSQSDNNSGYLKCVITGLLEQLDGFVRREGVVVVAACNDPKSVDLAIMRAGRLDRHLMLQLPDGPSRLAILKFHSGIQLSDADSEKFCLATNGFSGADIQQLVRGAKRAARRLSVELCAVHVMDQLPSLIGLSVDYLRTVALHEAGHAIVAFESGHEVTGITISRFRASGSSNAVGQVGCEPLAGHPRTKTTYLNFIAICLGGLAAEIEVLGEFSDGSSGSASADLNRATEIATMIESVMGMGHTLVAETSELDELARMRLLNHELRRQVHLLLDREFARARSIIQQHRPALDAIADRLMRAPEMTGQEVVEIIKSNRQGLVRLARPSRQGRSL